jgi:hypothetical protein
MATKNEEVWELWHTTWCGNGHSEGFMHRGTAVEIAAEIEKIDEKEQEQFADPDYEDNGVTASLWVCRPGGWKETEVRAEDWLSEHKARTKRDDFWARVDALGVDIKFNHNEQYESFADGFTNGREVTFEALVEDALACHADIVLKIEDVARERFVLNMFLDRAAKIAKHNTQPMHLAKYRVKTGDNDGDFVLRFVEWTDRWTPEGEEWHVPISCEGGELLYSYAAPVPEWKGEPILNCLVNENGFTKIPKDILPILLHETNSLRGVMWIELAVFRELKEDTRGIYCVMSDAKFVELFGLDAKPPNRDFVQCFVNELGCTIIPKAVMKRVGIPNGGGVMYLRELDGKTLLLSDDDYVRQMGFGSEDKDDPDV